MAAALSSIVLGCAQVPKESVELSATLGRDLQEVQRSHRRAVDLLFDRNVEVVNRYLDEVVTPTFVQAAIDATGTQMGDSLRAALAPGASIDANKKAFSEMTKVVQDVLSRVARQRRELLEPIEESRRTSLQELDLAYAEMQRANSVLTAHLSSVAKVQSIQDQAFERAGLPGFRERVGDAALLANAKVTQVLGELSDTQRALEELRKKLRELSK